MSTSSASTVRRLPNRDAALKALYDDVFSKNMFPFWATSTDVEHDEIKQLLGTSRAVPFLWRCAEDIEPILNRAVELVTMDDSERRSLILVNPGLAPKRATVSTMYTAYRLNDANEIMPPHKPFAERRPLWLEGQGQFHRRRWREHRVRPRRHGADAERHLAQPRHRRKRAGAQSFGARSAAGGNAQRRPLRARLQGRRERQARLEEAADARASRPTTRNASMATAA